MHPERDAGENHRSASDAIRRIGASRAAQIALITVGLLGIAEGVTRVFITSPSRQISDPVLGYSYIPGTVMFNGAEGGAPHVVNALGFLDEEVGPKGDRPRLLIVGDSMTEGAQVARRDGYVSRLRSMRPDLDIVSVAQAAAGPLEYRALAQYRTKLQADFVLFAFSTGDVDEILCGHSEVARMSDGTIADIHVRPTTRNRIKGLMEPVLHHSALATFAARRFGRIFKSWSDRLWPQNREHPLTNDASEAAAVLTFLLKEASLQGSMAVTFLPDVEYSAARQSRVTARSSKDEGVVVQAAAESGVPVYRVDEDIVRQYAETGQPGHGFANSTMGSGHMNPLGHLAVAHALTRELQTVFPRIESASNAVQ